MVYCERINIPVVHIFDLFTFCEKSTKIYTTTFLVYIGSIVLMYLERNFDPHELSSDAIPPNCKHLEISTFKVNMLCFFLQCHRVLDFCKSHPVAMTYLVGGGRVTVGLRHPSLNGTDPCLTFVL